MGLCGKDDDKDEKDKNEKDERPESEEIHMLGDGRALGKNHTWI